MRNNKNIPQTKSESRISQELKKYARMQMGQKSNNISSITIPQSQDQFDNKKHFYSKNNYTSQTLPADNSKKTEYKYNTKNVDKKLDQNIPNRLSNQNHSFFVSKNERNSGKNFTPRSSYTYKQPESKNFNEKYRERNIVSNVDNNTKVKRKYETTSYEHPGRRQRNYENKIYQGEKEPPKYYRNNPHKYNNNKDLNNLGGALIAQKICNIVIKGDSSNIEKGSTNNLSNNNKRRNKNQMIEYEIEEADIKNNKYNNQDDSAKREKNKKIKKKIKTKKNSYNDMIEMQKAQSFQQPRDFNYMPKQKYSKPKFVIGIDDDNKSKNSYNKDNDIKAHLKTDGGNYKINYNITNKDNNIKKDINKENPKSNSEKPNQKTHIIITNRSKINNNLSKNNESDIESNKTPRNKNQEQVYNKNYNYNSSQKQPSSYLNTIPNTSQRTNNIIQSKLNKDVKNDQKNNNNNLNKDIQPSNQKKERPRSLQKNNNYWKTDTTQNKPNLENKEKTDKKRFIITITTSYRRDKNKNDENKTEKKYSSYSYAPKRENKLKEKEIEIPSKDNKNINTKTIQTQPKKDEKAKEKNNVTVSYISNKTDQNKTPSNIKNTTTNNSNNNINNNNNTRNNVVNSNVYISK